VDGLGLPVFVIPLVAAVAGAFAGPAAARLFSGPSSTSQEAVEKQIKLQHELEIKRMLEQSRIQSQQVDQLAPLVLPALGLFALVAVLS
jgi:hypothetical protein